MDPIRVLVAEDHFDLRHLLDLSLVSHGLTVITAVDGQDALEKLEQARPDVLVTDLVMPRLDGLDLVLKLRDMPGYERLPVLLLTALPDHARSVLLSSLPRTRVMAKPPTLRDLEPVIIDLVGRSGPQ